MEYFNNLIPKEICSNILTHALTAPPSAQDEWTLRRIYSSPWIMQNKYTSQTVHFLSSILSNSLDNILYPEWVEVNEWPINSFQKCHVDSSRNHTKHTSITYLNSNYKGGKTKFTNFPLESENKIGDTIMFDGLEHEHEVTKITEGTRYTLAIWYSDNINDYILNW